MEHAQPAISVTPQSRSTLGEGPSWWAGRRRLVSVDIREGSIHSYDPLSGEDEVEVIGGQVSAVLPRRGGGKLVALDHELRAYDRSGVVEKIWSVETEVELNRFNDCRSDQSGRVWAGTMSTERVAGQAALYRLDLLGRLTQEVAATTLSNGLGWAPDGRRMYFIDSTTYVIDAFDYDESTGSVAHRTPFVSIDERDGLPDGLTVDSEGGVWVALFGGGAIRRYDSTGKLTHHLGLPVTNPTCPAFGGDRLDVLYVTSAQIKLSAEQLEREPAGALLEISGTGFSGFAANECAV